MSNDYEKTIEHSIVPLVESQFPKFYQESGPDFIEFVKYYYKWMEEPGNTLYHTRRFLEYKDIDDTVDSFLIHYKEKYLKNIKINSFNSTRNLTKHSLDLYRSKGTERGIDLLFRAEFGSGADVYYPSTDLFRLSDGDYKSTYYLEVSLNDNLNVFLNREIIGNTSGARAYCERIIRRTVKNRLIDVLFISSITGDFQTSEFINLADNSIQLSQCPTVIGSLNSIQIDQNGTGTGYKVGDEVDLTSQYGSEGKGLVTKTADFTGLVDFKLKDGGYGYTANATVIVSDHVLRITNTHFTGSDYYTLFDDITQSYGTLNYLNSNGTFSAGDNVYSYYANSTISSQGTVLRNDSTNSSSGQLLINLTTGNFSNLAIYKTGNTVSANLSVSNGFFNSTATGKIVAIDDNMKYLVSNTNGSFNSGDIIYQIDSNGRRVTYGICNTLNTTVGSNADLYLTRTTGFFDPTKTIYNESGSNTQALSATITIGVSNTNNTFITILNNKVSTNNFNGMIDFVSDGQGATFGIANNLLYTEVIQLNTDIIGTYANVALSNTYGFTALPTANLSTIIDSALTYANTTIGKISSIKSINPGQFYSYKPFQKVYEQKIAQYQIPDFILKCNNITGLFQSGELLVQANTNARGLIKSIDNDVLYVQNLRFYSNNFFQPNMTISGDSSGVTANPISVSLDYSEIEGQNAEITSSTITGNGSITAMDVIDSGFGFTENDVLSFNKDGIDGVGIAVISRQGKSKGYYRSRDSWASDTKKLFDGEYYQEYSYDIKSEVSMNKYSDILKQIMHLAGTKFFGTYVKKSVINTNRNIAISISST